MLNTKISQSLTKSNLTPSTPKYTDFFCLEYRIPIRQMFLHSLTLSFANRGITNFAFCQVTGRTNSQTITAVRKAAPSLWYQNYQSFGEQNKKK